MTLSFQVITSVMFQHVNKYLHIYVYNMSTHINPYTWRSYLLFIISNMEHSSNPNSILSTWGWDKEQENILGVVNLPCHVRGIKAKIINSGSN